MVASLALLVRVDARARCVRAPVAAAAGARAFAGSRRWTLDVSSIMVERACPRAPGVRPDAALRRDCGDLRLGGAQRVAGARLVAAPRWAAPSSGSLRSVRGCCPRRSRSRPSSGADRLNWPTSYWNATGLIAALGVVLCAHLASSVRDHPALRVLGSAAVPPLVAAVVFSAPAARRRRRGLIAAVVYLVLGRSRGMLTGLPVVLVFGGLAAARALGVERARRGRAHGRRARHGPRDGGAARRPRGGCRGRARAAAARGRPTRALAGAEDGAVAGAGARSRRRRRAGGRRARGRWGRPRPRRMGRVLLDRGRGDHPAAGASGSRSSATTGGSRSGTSRCTGGFEQRPWIGVGAGTYPCCGSAIGRLRRRVRRALGRSSRRSASWASSGWRCWLALVVISERCGGGPFATGLRHGVRSPPVATAWAAPRRVDWDWEMPAVTAWLFAAGGLALGRPLADRAPRRAAWALGGRSGSWRASGASCSRSCHSILRSQER